MVGGAAAVLSRARLIALVSVGTLLVVYASGAERLWELPTRWDVALVGLVVFPLSTAAVWLALPLSNTPPRHPIVLPAIAGMLAVAFALIGLDGPFNVAKLAAFALVGFALLWLFEALWWVALVAALVPWVDIWSVSAGPTRHVIEERPGIIERFAVGSRFPGEESIIYLGPPDVIFFALFLAAASRFGLRVGWTWLAMTALLSLTLAAVVLGDLTGLPALPAVCFGFLVPNADLLVRDVRAAWRDRRAARAADLRQPRAKMHADELEIDEALVRRLLTEQFPAWAGLPLGRVGPSGTDNAIFRLGEGLAVRLARREGPTEPGGKEHDWLPKLAPLLPLVIPTPVAQGRPTSEYPWFWDVHTWIEGETAPVEEIDEFQAARDLAAFVAALQNVDPTDAPPGRGIPLAERDEEIRHWLARFDGDPVVEAEWERALAAPPWDGPPVWHHGDLDARNWLVRDRRIIGVLDWASTGVGDPACDVMVAWKLHSAAARDAFREELPTDDATWERARGWALSQAVAALAYYTPENNPSLYREAEAWLALALSEA